MEPGGKTAVVTGAASGIGEATALRLAKEGAAVVVADIDEEGGRGTVAAIAAAGGSARFVAADVTSEQDTRTVIATAVQAFGGLDIVVNNAGGVEAPFFPEAPVERWTRVLDLNLRAVMLATQLAIDAMGRRGGAIVNVSSVAGLGLRPHAAPDYAAAKAAVVRLTATLAPLARTLAIRVNCICPDWVDTPAVRRSLARATPEELASVPPVLVPPQETAEGILRLVRDETLAGRVLVHLCGEEPRLLPPDRAE